jgi:hypothetical protein
MAIVANFDESIGLEVWAKPEEEQMETTNYCNLRTQIKSAKEGFMVVVAYCAMSAE